MEPRSRLARHMATCLRPRFLRRTVNHVRSLTTVAPPSSGPSIADQLPGRDRVNRLDGLPLRSDSALTKAPSRSGQRQPHPGIPENHVAISLDGTSHRFSPVLLRDLCKCPRCVDTSTRQKLFSTVEIPADVRATVLPPRLPDSITLQWSEDLPSAGAHHVTTLPLNTLRNIARRGSPVAQPKLPNRVLWSAERFRRDVQDLDYDAYMSDDSVLNQALQHLHTHGLLFLTNVPDSEKSVATVAERIGPVKNTFYGYTWDVRSVPEAKNVAYTSQDLGFHMDLLYMEQPPHLQFLHCIRSSSAGGASLFTDSYKAAQDLFVEDRQAFFHLSKRRVSFHYDHMDSHYYHQHRNVIEPSHPLVLGQIRVDTLDQLLSKAKRAGLPHDFKITDWIEAISWSPPFQGPFSLPIADDPSGIPPFVATPPTDILHIYVEQWHAAASKFNQLIHKRSGIYERMMKPGECVLFDNRRVLHARKAFEVADVGKERWLRGAYLDKDPYLSKLRVLQKRFGSVQKRARGFEDMFEAMAEDGHA